MARALAAALLLVALLAGQASLAARVMKPLQQLEKKHHSKHHHKDKPRKTRFTSPVGLFIQERASKQLPGPGQHFSFGSLKPWEDVHALLDTLPDSKLVFLVRHGQAVSNFLADTLGPDEWFVYEEKCSYTDSNNTYWGIFDAELTELGRAEAVGLNSMLNSGGWFDKLTLGKPVHGVVSPLSRCLQTYKLALEGLPVAKTDVEEKARETLGEDTCDARRSASDPHDKTQLVGPCDFELGLRSKFPEFEFPVVAEGEGLGLHSDADVAWTKDRETQQHQTKRALAFLSDLWEYTEEQVAFVVTHSGFTRSVLLAVGREPYRPQNTELVPVVIQRLKPAEHDRDDDDDSDDGGGDSDSDEDGGDE